MERKPWPWWMIVGLGTITMGLLLACSQAGGPSPTLAPQVEDDRRVCIDNDREFTIRAEVRDAQTGTEYAELYLPSFGETCERVELARAGEMVTVTLKAVGGPDATPMAFRDLLVTGRAMRLTIGMDGVTPYAHSSRSQAMPQEAPPMSPAMMEKLGTFAANYPNEIGFCVEEGSFHIPYVEQAIKSGMRVKEYCPKGTDVWWHSHPQRMLFNGRFKVWYERLQGRPPDSVRDLCYLSRTDVETAKERNAEHFVVGVNQDIWCWWTAEQVEEIEYPDAINHPPEGQVSWDG